MLNVDVYHYNTLSDGIKKVYTNDDELKEYGDRGILDPNSVTYYSLFINGILQPKVNYEIQKGQLTLKTEDVPLKDSPIIITFVTIKEETYLKLNSALAEGMLPSGQTSVGPVTDLDINVDNTVVNSNLKLEKAITSGPMSVITGQISQWEYTLTISNTGDTPVTNIIVTDNILLDTILNIDNLFLSQGNIIIEYDTITWAIEVLDAGQSATASFKLEGFFNTNGIRFISRSFSTGSATGPISTDIIHTEPVEVSKGLCITNTIVSGSLNVKIGKLNTWRVEIKISNSSNDNISDILVMDKLFIERIHDIKIVNISKGNVKLCKNKILWKIEELKIQEISILVLDIMGAFNSNGFRNLSTTLGLGNISNEIIFSNIANDFQIIVYPTLAKIKKGLLIEKNILNEPLAGFLDTFKKWTFSIKITNTTNDFLTNIIVTDYMLFDKLDYINILSIPSGNISISHDSIIWNIDELFPGQSLIATFKARGLFSTTGFRAINRAVATGFNPKPYSCILSNITSGKPISIYDPINDLTKTCILVNKVFFECQQRNCIREMIVPIGKDNFKKIIFKPGFIVDDTLMISDIENNPNFKRVKFLLKIPFQIITTNNNIIADYLPNMPIDIIMHIPEARDEFLYNIDVETSSELLCLPIKQNDQLNFPVGVFIKVKAVGKVQLLIPTYEFSSKPSTLEKDSTCNFDISRDILDYYLAQNLSPNKDSAKVIQGNQCPDIFGRLKIEKYIISGPLKVSSDTVNTWIVEIRITNDGNGPISNVIMIDTLLLDKLIDLNVISPTQGDVHQQENKIIWNIGTLNSNETAIFLAEITGFFYNEGNNIFTGERYQYNTVSDGTKKVYTNDDNLIVYGNVGIPNPDEASFLNLFVNGVLQPKSNYTVEEGALTLLTNGVPNNGVPIILEYFKIKNKDDQLLKADVYQYNTIAKGKDVYTNDDELTMYGNKGILDPNQTSYINLFINGVIQPKTNYSVKEGILELIAEPLPIEGAPIILQFISFL